MEVVIVEGEVAVLRVNLGQSHCNQWGFCCIVVWSARTNLDVVWCSEWLRHSCIRWGSRGPRVKGIRDVFVLISFNDVGLFSDLEM